MANRNQERNPDDYYLGYRYPKILIGHVVWLYHRFMLSLRDISEMLFMRGIALSYETIRSWNLTFGQSYANDVKRRAPRRGDKWHMDEMCLSTWSSRSIRSLWSTPPQNPPIWIDHRRAALLIQLLYPAPVRVFSHRICNHVSYGPRFHPGRSDFPSPVGDYSISYPAFLSSSQA
jgi:hypothetical protein